MITAKDSEAASLGRKHDCQETGRWDSIQCCFHSTTGESSVSLHQVCTVHIHRVPKKTCDYIFYNNFNNKCPITIIFGIVSSKSMSHRKIVSFPTSPT